LLQEYVWRCFGFEVPEKLEEIKKVMDKLMEEERQKQIRNQLDFMVKKRKMEEIDKERNFMKFNKNMFNNSSLLKAKNIFKSGGF